MKERSKMHTKVKEGAAAIYTVVFFCLLIGIVTLGFVSIMIQDILGSTNYDLSQSAYDSALAGVEDAKVLLIRYNACINGSSKDTNCQSILNKVNDTKSSENCDLVREALGRARGEHETLIQSDNKSMGSSNASEKLDKSIDMAYTCVKVARDTEDYLGTLTETTDMKVIPLRTSNATFNRIRIEWFDTEDNRKVNSSNFSGLLGEAFTTAKKVPESDAKYYNFKNTSTLPPVLRVGLIQTPTSFRLSDFDKPLNGGTNRGTLILRPTGGSTRKANLIHSSATDGFYGSALSGFDGNDYNNTSIKALNTPRDVECLNATNFGKSSNNYACQADIDLPNNTAGDNDSTNRFLLLSSVYAQPETSFSVKMYQCNDLNTVTNSSNCKLVPFAGVQSKVDSTGRANDLFRRVEARVELQDANFPLVKYGLSVYGDKSGEGEIMKNYWATKNCWYKTNGENRTCSNYQAITTNSWGN